MQPAHWPADYNTDLIDLLGVLGLLVDLEPDQARLLDRVCRPWDRKKCCAGTVGHWRKTQGSGNTASSRNTASRKQLP